MGKMVVNILHTMNYKAEILIPTVQYGNIRFFIEGTDEEIIAQAKDLQRKYEGGFGLPTKEWNAALDEFNSTGTLKNGVELFNQMNDFQQRFFQEQKKSIKRLKIDEDISNK